MSITWRAANKANDYYAVTDPKATHVITVVHTKHGTFVCLTCRAIGCQHSLDVEAFVEDGNGPQRAPAT